MSSIEKKPASQAQVAAGFIPFIRSQLASKNLRFSNILAALVLLSLILALGSPIIALISYSLGSQADNIQVIYDLFRFYIPSYLINTLLLCLMGAGICFIWGVSCAWLVTRFNFIARKYLRWMLILPLSCPVYISGFVYSDIFTPYFPSFHNIFTASFLLGSALFPYVYVFAAFAFRQQSMNYDWAAKSFGFNSWKIFYKISLPMALPLISFGCLLATIEIINEYGLVSHYAINTISLGVYIVWLGLGDRSGAVILSLLVLLIICCIMLAEGYILSKRKRYENQSSHVSISIKTLSRSQSWLCFVWCFLPVLIGFAAPLIALIYYAYNNLAAKMSATAIGDPADSATSSIASIVSALPDGLSAALSNSLSLALGVIAICISLGLIINYTSRKLHKSMHNISQGINILYAVPGTLIAFTCIVIFSALNTYLSGNSQLSGGIFFGALFILFAAYAMRFTPVANRSMFSSLNKITPSMEMASQLLARDSLHKFRRIYIPLLKASIINSSLIIFIDIIKELPIVIILRPFNFETLASLAYQYATDERLGDAAAPALVIILASMPIIYLFNRFFTSSRSEQIL